MKKTTLLLLTIAMLVGFLFTGPASVQAQTVTPPGSPAAASTPAPLTAADLAAQLVSGPDVVPFAQIGFEERVMLGPYDAAQLRFTLPPEWKLENGAAIQFVLRTSFTGSFNEQGIDLSQLTGGTLEVTFNEQLIESVVLDWEGDQVVTVNIPAGAQIPTRDDGRHVLDLFLNAATDCRFDHQTTLVIRSNSQFVLPHSSVAPALDLRTLPQPFFYRDSIVPPAVKLVVPEQQSESSLRAALTLGGGFARLAGTSAVYDVKLAGQLTAEDRASANLIFVGKASDFGDLAQVLLPAPVANGSFNIGDAAAETGLIQIAPSPWNPDKAVLVVGGNSDEAVIKAAQAVSSGVIIPGSSNQLALIDQIRENTAPQRVPVDRTLIDLANEMRALSNVEPGATLFGQRITSIGVTTTDYSFYIPFGQEAADEAYFDLTFNHSSLLSFDRSGIVVLVNGQPVGSVRFTDETTDLTTQRIRIPAYTLIPGENILTIEASMIPLDLCAAVGFNNIWLAISGDSLLHIPLGPAKPTEVLDYALSTYPQPFVADPTLSDLTFVVSGTDAVAWQSAVKLAADLSRRAFGDMIALNAAFGSFKQTAEKPQHLIVVGKPVDLPILQDLSGVLPAPYPPQSNIAQENAFRVSYKLPPDVELGYLQFLADPNAPDKYILAVLGTSDAGLGWATTALTTDLRSRVGGNFAVIRDRQVLTADTRLTLATGNLQATALPEQAVPDVVSPEAAAEGVTAQGRPTWLLPAIGVFAALIVLLLLAVAIRKRK